MSEEKIYMKIALDNRVRKKIWDNVYKKAIVEGTTLKGVFNKLIIEAIKRAIENPPELEEGREYHGDKTTTIIIPKTLRNKLLEAVMNKYGTKYGTLTYVINFVLDTMLE